MRGSHQGFPKGFPTEHQWSWQRRDRDGKAGLPCRGSVAKSGEPPVRGLTPGRHLRMTVVCYVHTSASAGARGREGNPPRRSVPSVGKRNELSQRDVIAAQIPWARTAWPGSHTVTYPPTFPDRTPCVRPPPWAPAPRPCQHPELSLVSLQSPELLVPREGRSWCRPAGERTLLSLPVKINCKLHTDSSPMKFSKQCIAFK